MQLNLDLSEKIQETEEREAKEKSKLQDSKDQAELLEFRVLELEEGQEMKKREQVIETSEVGTETELDANPDSGCVSLQHSRAPSQGQVSDALVLQFQDQKIQETQLQLQALVREVAGPSSKSLLLQTVALFEALLVRIKELQEELGRFRRKAEEDRKNELDEGEREDGMVLEMEQLSKELNRAKQELEKVHHQLDSGRELNIQLKKEVNEKKEYHDKKEEVHRKQALMQSKVEDDLRMQVSDLAKKLNATLVGCRSESEMHGESVLKVMEYEKIAGELQNTVQELRTENGELRVQLSIALEHQTTKSTTGSLGSELGEAKDEKPPSSGIGSDLSDSETYDSEHSSMRSRSSSPDKLFSKSGVFDLKTDCADALTTEQYLKRLPL